MKLNNLHIKSFRGATKPLTVHFSQNKPITLIYAENGNGKTSITDSLVCLCTNGIGSLDDKSNKDDSFLKSLGSSNSDLLIQLQTDTQVYKATLSSTANKIVKTPNTGLPKLSALRRSQITSFIEDPPSKRYEVLSSFIDVSNIQKSESELKKLITATDRDYNASTRSLSDAQDTLTNIWNKEGKPLGDLNAWIASEIKKDILKLAEELGKNNSALTAWNTLQSTVQQIKAEKPKFDIAANNLKTAEANLKIHKDQNPNSESELLSILNETKSFLGRVASLEKCPVCEKENEKEALLKSVNGRIVKMQELNKLTQLVISSKAEREKWYNRLMSQTEPFQKQLISFKTSSAELKSFNFSTLLEKIISSGETKDNFKEYLAVEVQLVTEVEKLKKHNESVNKSHSQYNAIKSNTEAITNLTKKCTGLSGLLKLSKDSLAILEASRKQHIDSVLSSISGEIERMYQSIHPNEGLGNIKLFLNHNYQGSLNLTANFYTQADITPQSVYSESHLDTLGICIFIALAKRESDQDMILVLDDVVMSVDEKHLDRIIDLIHSESQHFSHIFITTHYRPWRERYRNNRAPNANVQFVELRGWTKERGITLAKPQLVLDELKWFLSTPENFHRENLAGTAGRFLEAILDFLSYNFQCRLRRKPGNDFTLSELLDCFSKDLLKLLKVQKMQLLPDGKYHKIDFTHEIFLKEHIDAIKNLKAVRNQVGAHFTFDGALVSDTDIEDFANATIQLTELLICPINGNLPDKNKSGSYWETKSGSIRLFPLNEP